MPSTSFSLGWENDVELKRFTFDDRVDGIDNFDFLSYTNKYDRNNNLYEQTGTWDNGDTWRVEHKTGLMGRYYHADTNNDAPWKYVGWTDYDWTYRDFKHMYIYDDNEVLTSKRPTILETRFGTSRGPRSMTGTAP
jgi:hypothetical protein